MVSPPTGSSPRRIGVSWPRMRVKKPLRLHRTAARTMHRRPRSKAAAEGDNVPMSFVILVPRPAALRTRLVVLVLVAGPAFPRAVVFVVLLVVARFPFASRGT